MNTLRSLLITWSLLLCVLGFNVSQIHAQETSFTRESLAQFDGKDGRKAYFAYKGKVYDATDSALWKLGEHFGLKAGYDLTDKMEGAPHGDEVMAKVPMIGSYQTTDVSVQTTEKKSPPTAARSWYDSPIRFWGISILGWTGIILGIVFALNFLTCFALPWSKISVPWAGSRPGGDELDKAPVHKNLASIHKYFAWATVVLGIFHGVLGFLQVFFKLFL